MTDSQQAICITLLFITGLMSLKLGKVWEAGVCSNWVLVSAGMQIFTATVVAGAILARH
jgi:hypothetical protein